MNGNAKQPIIVKKKKGGGHGHHGGAWKIAYADMVTAMMAFFLVMWICGMDVKTRLGIADYFSNPSSQSGPNKPSSWFFITSGGVPRLTQGNLEQSKEKGGEPDTVGVLRMDPAEKDNFDEELANLYAKALATVVERDPEFAALKDAIMIEVTDEGLRVELMEGDEPRFFVSGSPAMTRAGRRVVESLGGMLGRSTHHLVFEGHTTPAPRVLGRGTKWDLGADRALAVRTVFQEAGLSVEKVKQIKSLGDTAPRFSFRPEDPRNLRVAIVIPYSKQQPKPSTNR
jgi:chemotaxis protein MotB